MSTLAGPREGLELSAAAARSWSVGLADGRAKSGARAKGAPRARLGRAGSLLEGRRREEGGIGNPTGTGSLGVSPVW